ncbi:hypothetical protein HDU76_002077 [Blyttiomyces sp. JEL0837]|nr:hypothetical protein HDU76_002077 [Blyttiomyces sp. JEL0837]
MTPGSTSCSSSNNSNNTSSSNTHNILRPPISIPIAIPSTTTTLAPTATSQQSCSLSPSSSSTTTTIISHFATTSTSIPSSVSTSPSQKTSAGGMLGGLVGSVANTNSSPSPNSYTPRSIVELELRRNNGSTTTSTKPNTMAATASKLFEQESGGSSSVAVVGATNVSYGHPDHLVRRHNRHHRHMVRWNSESDANTVRRPSLKFDDDADDAMAVDSEDLESDALGPLVSVSSNGNGGGLGDSRWRSLPSLGYYGSLGRRKVGGAGAGKGGYGNSNSGGCAGDVGFGLMGGLVMSGKLDVGSNSTSGVTAASGMTGVEATSTTSSSIGAGNASTSSDGSSPSSGSTGRSTERTGRFTSYGGVTSNVYSSSPLAMGDSMISSSPRPHSRSTSPVPPLYVDTSVSSTGGAPRRQQSNVPGMVVNPPSRTVTPPSYQFPPHSVTDHAATLDDPETLISPFVCQFFASLPELGPGFRLLPEFIQKYMVKDPLGQGGTAVVFSAIRRSDGKDVAVKFIFKDRIPAECWKRDRALGMVPIEVFVLKRLEHQNIVRFYECFEDGTFIYVVMEAVHPLAFPTPTSSTPTGPGLTLESPRHHHHPVVSNIALTPSIPQAQAIASPAFPLLVKLTTNPITSTRPVPTPVSAIALTSPGLHVAGPRLGNSPSTSVVSSGQSPSHRRYSESTTGGNNNGGVVNKASTGSLHLSVPDIDDDNTGSGMASSSSNSSIGSGCTSHTTTTNAKNARRRSRRSSQDLFDCIERNPRMSEPVICGIFKQIVDAVGYLHSKGFVHRDIKDENVIIDDRMQVKLIDFGAARSVPGNNSKGDWFREFNGTVGYMAPEQESCFPFTEPNDPRTSPPMLRSRRSESYCNLLHHILDPNPETRITVDEILKHPWVVSCGGEKKEFVEKDVDVDAGDVDADGEMDLDSETLVGSTTTVKTVGSINTGSVGGGGEDSESRVGSVSTVVGSRSATVDVADASPLGKSGAGDNVLMSRVLRRIGGNTGDLGKGASASGGASEGEYCESPVPVPTGSGGSGGDATVDVADASPLGKTGNVLMSRVLRRICGNTGDSGKGASASSGGASEGEYCESPVPVPTSSDGEEVVKEVVHVE